MLSTLEIKVFENDNTSGMEHSKISDCGSNLDRKFVIQPAGIKPQCMGAGITMFSLPTLNSVQYVIQMVFITRKVDKLSLEDSSIGSHDTAHSIGIESKVHGTDALVNQVRIPDMTVLLTAPPGIITQRIRGRNATDPDLTKVLDNQERLRKMRYFLQKYRIPSMEIDTSNCTPKQIAQQIIHGIKKRA